MIVSSLSEVIAAISTGILVNKLGIKLAFTVNFFICTIASFMLLMAVTYEEKKWVPTFLLFAKFGATSGLSMVYMST